MKHTKAPIFRVLAMNKQRACYRIGNKNLIEKKVNDEPGANISRREVKKTVRTHRFPIEEYFHSSAHVPT